MRALVEKELSKSIGAVLAKELLDAYDESKRNFYLGGLRLSAVEGGRFCEAAYRILEQLAAGKHTPIGKTLDTEQLTKKLAGLPSGTLSDSVRLHIPRCLRVVYDIRNKRDAAHLGDGIDPNLQDATLVIGILDWVTAEFIRLLHKVDANTAHELIRKLVTRTAPVIQEFSGVPKVLSPGLGASDHTMVLLYHYGVSGARLEDLRAGVRSSMRANLTRTLNQLAGKKDLAHFDGQRWYITRLGENYVERNRLLDGIT